MLYIYIISTYCIPILNPMKNPHVLSTQSHKIPKVLTLFRSGRHQVADDLGHLHAGGQGLDGGFASQKRCLS
jgi:hypothetical protein